MQTVQRHRYPMELARNGVVRRVSMLAGAMLCGVMPSRCKRLESGEAARGWLDRTLMAGIVFTRRRRGTIGELAHLHQLYWQGDHGADYHARRSAAIFQEQFLVFHREFIEVLGRHLAGRPIKSLVETGCGAGFLLEYMQQHLRSIERFVGIDLSAAQIERNRVAHRDKPLEFFAGEMTEWLPANTGAGWSFCFYGGVLEYLPPEKLQALMAWAATQGPACFALVEPLYDFDPETETRSRATTAEYSFAHPYALMLEAAGFRVVWKKVQPSPDFRWMMLVAEL